MKNVTITLDERTGRVGARIAARQNKSVSRIVGEMLRERMQALHDDVEALLSWQPLATDAELLRRGRGRVFARAPLPIA